VLQRWGVWYAVAGDLRFLSHHDMMRTMERAATRASLPLKYSEGFNPRPILSLVCPRPVGVTTRGDLLALTLAGAMPNREILDRLNRHAPGGMEFLRAEPLPPKYTPRAARVEYELDLPAPQAGGVRARLADLNRRESWPVERQTLPRRRKRRAPPTARAFDLKPLTADLACENQTLRWTLVPQGDRWGRPGELLAMLGLDPRADLARVVRTAVEYVPTPHPQAPTGPRDNHDTPPPASPAEDQTPRRDGRGEPNTLPPARRDNENET